jgi:hypothetical protein
MEEPLLNILRFPLTLSLSHQVLKCTRNPYGPTLLESKGESRTPDQRDPNYGKFTTSVQCSMFYTGAALTGEEYMSIQSYPPAHMLPDGRWLKSHLRARSTA